MDLVWNEVQGEDHVTASEIGVFSGTRGMISEDTGSWNEEKTQRETSRDFLIKKLELLSNG